MNGKKNWIIGTVLLAAFAVFTVLVCRVDVQPVGVNGTDIGFAAVNTWFHRLTGEHLALYELTDILELAAIAVCLLFGCLGAWQFIRRRSLWKVDRDILLLGVYYVVVIAAYLFFEKVVLNYRPMLIEGKMEPSYPSSTTLLVLSVMPTLKFQADRRLNSGAVKRILGIAVIVFSVLMVLGRLLSGVHWLTDIVGSCLLSMGLYSLYCAAATDGYTGKYEA